MITDWKKFSASPGYISLKAAMTNDYKRSGRDRKELMKLFRRVIVLAQNHAHHMGVPPEEILNAWEHMRDHWWLNFYSEYHMPKMRAKDSLQPQGINGLRKYYARSWTRCPVERKHRVCQAIKNQHIKDSTKEKKRWSNAYKAAAKYRANRSVS